MSASCSAQKNAVKYQKMSLLHSSTRRPAALKATDYDHEIILVDHTAVSPERTASPVQEDVDRQSSPGLASDTSSRRHSDVPLRKHNPASKKLRQQITRRKYGKYKGQPVGEDGASFEEEGDTSAADTDGQEILTAEPTNETGNGHTNGDTNGETEERGRSKTTRPKPKDDESAIDILYENQRGGFLCGIPLFSSKALGNLDPSPWTNCAKKTSATNITNAQVPDPSWEWAWKDWSINHTDEVDENGWEYSFMFAKFFSWHGPTWYSSCVRRRAWIRKRVKKHAQYHVQDSHMLNSDYFTIHPVVERSGSRGSTLEGTVRNRYSVAQLARQDMDQQIVLEDITDIPSLMKALKVAIIDREKMEAVKSFIEHGGDELYYLRDKMHDIMGIFIFQTSRKLLLSYLLNALHEATEQQKVDVESKQEPDATKLRRLENLEVAVKHADEEVKRLEFWSDVKEMAERGVTKGAVDEDQGWDETWAGIDRSGPEDVISKKNAIGTEDCDVAEEKGIVVSPEPSSNDEAKEPESPATEEKTKNEDKEDSITPASDTGKGRVE